MFWISITLMAFMVFSIPITAILTEHKRRSAKIHGEIVKDQLALEQIKQENFILETEKMKMELEKMKLEYNKEETKLLL